MLFVAHFCQSWGVILFLTNAPIYMKEVLKFDIKANGLLLSIPYASCLIVIILTGLISDKLTKSFHFDVCKVRKLFNALGENDFLLIFYFYNDPTILMISVCC